MTLVVARRDEVDALSVVAVVRAHAVVVAGTDGDDELVARGKTDPGGVLVPGRGAHDRAAAAASARDGKRNGALDVGMPGDTPTARQHVGISGRVPDRVGNAVVRCQILSSQDLHGHQAAVPRDARHTCLVVADGCRHSGAGCPMNVVGVGIVEWRIEHFRPRITGRNRPRSRDRACLAHPASDCARDFS